MTSLISKRQFTCLFLTIISLLIFTGINSGSNLKVKVKVDEAKIRFDASLESEVVHTVKIGSILKAEEKVGEWYQVTITPQEYGFAISGYIHESEIEIIKEKIENYTIREANLIVGGKKAPESYRYSVSGKLIYTTADIDYEYEILGIVTHYQEFGVLTLRDPLEGAIKSGMGQFEKKAIKMGGDAVVGLRYNFANRTQKDEGRLLIYGTVVRFK